MVSLLEIKRFLCCGLELDRVRCGDWVIEILVNYWLLDKGFIFIMWVIWVSKEVKGIFLIMFVLLFYLLILFMYVR